MQQQIENIALGTAGFRVFMVVLVAVLLAPALGAQQIKIIPFNTSANDMFGGEQALDVSGDFIIGGAPENATRPGSAYVFGRNQGGVGNWGQVNRLAAPDGAPGDAFGDSAAIEGDWAVVGAPQDDDLGAASGAAFIFYRNQGGPNAWGFVKKILPSDGAPGDQFGASVDFDGNFIIVGAPFEDDVTANSGAAYIFDRNLGGPNQFGQVTRVKGSLTLANHHFGAAVGISGNTAVVGAPDGNAIYIYDKDLGGSNTWGERARLNGNDSVAGDTFGADVAIDGDLIVAGAPWNDTPLVNGGSAYVFARNFGGANVWGQEKELVPGDIAVGDLHGWSVDVFGDRTVVGSQRDDDVTGDAGSAYVYERNEGGLNQWGRTQKFTPFDGAVSDYYGSAIAVHGDTIVVGSPLDDNAPFSSGSAYISSPVPACTLEVTLSHGSGLLFLDLDLGTTEPANLGLWLAAGGNVARLVYAPVPVINPPVGFQTAFPLAGAGNVGILTAFVTARGITCYDIDVINTGLPGGSSQQEIRRLLDSTRMQMGK